MASDRRIRYVLLCEDRLQERFFREVASRLQMTAVRIVRKSRGAGGARQAVERDYPREVQALRSKRYQRYLGLVTVVDGDEVGFEGRRRAMESSLEHAGMEPRSREDRVALEIPTWSIETWLGGLNGETDLDETTRYKHAAWLPDRSQSRVRTESIRSAADRFVELLASRGEIPELPALAAGLEEFRRFQDR
jgi:hypothetical protein